MDVILKYCSIKLGKIKGDEREVDMKKIDFEKWKTILKKPLSPRAFKL